MKNLVKSSYPFSLLIILFSVSPWLFCQSESTGTIKSEKVYRIVYEIHPNEWYVQQAELWGKEIDKTPKNAQAWLNYYNAIRYARYTETIGTQDKQQKLKQIIEDMEKVLPDAYEYYQIKERNDCDIHDISLSEKVYRMRPDNATPLYTLISHSEIYGKEKQMKEYCQKLYDNRDIESWLISYNYNVLMSTEQNAIIFTNGDNDTYPCWLLQEVQGIRQDVLVVNISLAPTKTYLEEKLKDSGIEINIKDIRKSAFNEKKEFSKAVFLQKLCKAINEKYPNIPIYFALTVYENYYESFKDDMYIVGLAFRFSSERIDNLAFLKKNLEQNFRLDYLSHDWYNENIIGKNLQTRINLNYVSPILMLVNHYELSGQNEKADRWLNLAKSIAKVAGKEDMIEEYMKGKGE